jgi:dihydromonapterin reductase/dihydrofolate reductase
MNRDPILITGVGKRAGLHLARTFLSRGLDVLGTYRTERPAVEELKELGAKLYQCDFNDEQQLARFIDEIKHEHRSLRAIIHNASEWLPDDAEIPQPEILQRMMQVHVSVPYQLNIAFAPLLQAAKSDHADIVHVGDYVSSRGSKKHIAYAASKAAQDCLTMSFSAKLSPKVKVNSVAPALILFNENDGEEYRDKTLRKSLMRREAGLEEFSHAINYLLESRYVTGRVLPMDGGRHLVQ